MSEIHRLEQDIAERRSRLNDTIDRIQDKLTVAGIVDEVMGQAGAARLATNSNAQLSRFLQRYPLPVMIAAAGIGFYMYRRSRRAGGVAVPARAMPVDVIDVPVLNDGQARVYEPDLNPTHPGLDEARPGRPFPTQA